MSGTRLILLRHGEVEGKYHQTFGGRIDMELSPLGQSQAVALANHLHLAEDTEAIYASPMKRVQQTLAPLLALGAPRPVIMPGLREWDFGEWTGMGWHEIIKRHRVQSSQWLHLLDAGEVPGAENGNQLRARVEPCLRQILADQPGRNVVVACHGGIVRVLLSIAMELPLPEMARFEVDYASVTILEVRRERATLKLLNHTPWTNGK
jgi:broad specificity phosphatase PhoE